MKNKSYSDKLKDPRWQKKRLEVLNLRGFKCESCSCETKELHVHHRFYLKGREVWEYDNDVFQVLCCDCHEKEHRLNQKETTKYDRIIDTINECKEEDAIELIDFILRSFIKSNSITALSFACNNYDVYGIITTLSNYCMESELLHVSNYFEIKNLQNKIDGRMD